MDRRNFLRTAGAITIVVANGEIFRTFAQAAEFGDGPEFEPWRTWQEDMQVGPLALVRAGILRFRQ